MLGFGASGIMGAGGDLGGYFYTKERLLSDVSVPSGSMELLKTGMSRELLCFSLRNELLCYFFNQASADDVTRPTTEVFVVMPALQSPTCTSSAPLGCHAQTFGVWQQSVAVLMGTPGSHHISTHYLSGVQKLHCGLFAAIAYHCDYRATLDAFKPC